MKLKLKKVSNLFENSIFGHKPIKFVEYSSKLLNQEKYVLIDVRAKGNFEAFPGLTESHNISKIFWEEKIDMFLLEHMDKKIVLISENGKDCPYFYRFLKIAKYKNVYILKNGLESIGYQVR